jgi:hypothetical protein
MVSITVIRTVIPGPAEPSIPTAVPYVQVPNTEGPPQISRLDPQSPFLRGRLGKEVREYAKATGPEVAGNLPEVSPAAPPAPSVIIRETAQDTSPALQAANVRRKELVGKRKKQCIPRDKGPLKRLMTRSVRSKPPASSGNNLCCYNYYVA